MARLKLVGPNPGRLHAQRAEFQFALFLVRTDHAGTVAVYESQNPIQVDNDSGVYTTTGDSDAEFASSLLAEENCCATFARLLCALGSTSMHFAG